MPKREGKIRKYTPVSILRVRPDTYGHSHRGIGPRCRHRSR